MLKKLIPLSALVLSLGVCAAAQATPFDFSFNFPAASTPQGFADSGSGTLNATFDAVNNYYLVTAITGTTSAFGAITGLLPPGSFGGNDNRLFYPNAPYLDFAGITFAVTGSGDVNGNVNIFYLGGNGGVDYKEFNGNVGDGSFIVTPASVAVPEPGALALFALGLLGLGVALRQKRSRL